MENRAAKNFDTAMKQACLNNCLLFQPSYITFHRISFCKTTFHAGTRTFISSQKDTAGGKRKYTIWRFTQEYDGVYALSAPNEYRSESEAKKGQLKFDYEILTKGDEENEQRK